MERHQHQHPIFDTNVHLPPGAAGAHDRQAKPDDLIHQELHATPDEIVGAMEQTIGQRMSQMVGANLMIFNQSLARDSDALEVMVRASQRQPIPIALTQLIDFRDEQAEENVKRLSESGFRAIKFHAYVQQITEEDFRAVVATAVWAQQAGLSICIDTSFGSLDLYRYDNLKLAAAVASAVCEVPIVLLHSGGARAIEAMLIAASHSNIFLETSFTLPWYRGSRIESDLAFAYRKIGASRVMVGSDHPYIDWEDSLQETIDFFETHRFSPAEQQQMMVGTARQVWGRS